MRCARLVGRPGGHVGTSSRLKARKPLVERAEAERRYASPSWGPTNRLVCKTSLDGRARDRYASRLLAVQHNTLAVIEQANAKHALFQ